MAKVKNNIKKFAQLTENERANQIKLSDEMTNKLEVILKTFEVIGVKRSKSMDCLIDLGLIRCGIWNNSFINYAGFMQNKICRSDEKLRFQVQNVKGYSNHLYESEIISDYLVLSKNYEEDADVEEFRLILGSRTLILLEYTSRIFLETFGYCPALLVDRSIVLGIEMIENSLKKGNNAKEIYTTMISWLAEVPGSILLNKQVFDVDLDNLFNTSVEA
jgi:hypothetical protein